MLLGDPIVMPDGRIGHAELRVGDTVFMLAGEFPEEQHLSPETLGGSTVGLMLHVPDSDATYARAVEHGRDRVATGRGVVRRTRRNDPRSVRSSLVRADRDRGRRRPGRGRVRSAVTATSATSRCWSPTATGPRASSAACSAGSSNPVTSPARSTSRRSHRRPASTAGPGSRRSASTSASTTSRPRRARVRELGGEVLSVGDYDSGGNAECVDDQGLRFDLFRPKPGY